MKRALLFIGTAIFMFSAKAQTVYVPSGTSGIGTSSNENVGIGTITPQGKLHVYGGDTYLWGLNLGYGINIAKITTDDASKPISFQIAGTEYMRLSNNGNVGIGTTSPIDKLQIHGTFISTGLYEGNGIYFSTTNGNTNWGVAQITPYIASNNGGVDGYPGGLEFKTKNPGISTSFPTTKMVIDANGNVGIGTTSPDQKLTVNGKIHAQEVIVDLNVPVADYVFAKGYKLMPLPEVEQYVQANSHLPEIPSAAEVKEKGMNMGDMQNQLLKKVEELTLYVIQQDKRIQALEEENKRLKK